MHFIADLHIHSRYSMATSKALTIHHLVEWANHKGINVLGSGDFTHPAWRMELQENLVFDEASGLYRLKDRENGPYFCLQAEISSIYKKDGKTRKIHNLIFAPNMDVANRISLRLAGIGNICSDGRPILKLDSRDLLEIVLESSPQSFLVPAHIWTPHFALFGSRSGFDRIEDCYEDLTQHIFALETGLSSDPPMNRQVSALDSYVMISNSDAHSGANLGREANLFSGQPSYSGMFAALQTSAKRSETTAGQCQFLGTLEFHPEGGKYHLDGHRKCEVVLSPAESNAINNICPVCGKPLTLGVLHRVRELADRNRQPELHLEPKTRMLIPLADVIGHILGAGIASKKTQLVYGKIVRQLAPELETLCLLPEEKIRAFWEPLGEAIHRIRANKIDIQSGYDGKYGTINIFTPQELAEFKNGKI